LRYGPEGWLEVSLSGSRLSERCVVPGGPSAERNQEDHP
jgi:hypothetical protein